MKRLISVITALLLIAAIPLRAADTSVSGETTSAEVTETAPETEKDETLDLARTFLNINFILFGCAVVLFIVCTVVFFVIRAKKAQNGKKN